MTNKEINNSKPFSFNFKLNFKKKRGTDKDIIKLLNTEDGHNKFYDISLLMKGNSPETGYTVVISYGKIGVIGSSKKHGFILKSDAYKFMNKKATEKIKRGYKRQ